MLGRVATSVVLVCIGVLAVAVWYAAPLLRTATGSVSLSVGNGVFVSGLDPAQVYREEQLPNPGMSKLAWALRYTVDRGRKRGPHDDPRRVRVTCGLPGGLRLPSRTAQLTFAEVDDRKLRQTKAVVVLHDGKLVAERYAPGCGADTPIWGHSLTKSVTSALIGVLVREDKLKIDQPAAVSAWRSPDDPRRAVTVDHLLRMDSDLPPDETDDIFTLATRMAASVFEVLNPVPGNLPAR